MASNLSEDYFMDDDFAAIVDILEADEEVERQAKNITQEAVKIEHICSLCE